MLITSDANEIAVGNMKQRSVTRYSYKYAFPFSDTTICEISCENPKMPFGKLEV